VPLGLATVALCAVAADCDAAPSAVSCGPLARSPPGPSASGPSCSLGSRFLNVVQVANPTQDAAQALQGGIDGEVQLITKIPSIIYFSIDYLKNRKRWKYPNENDNSQYGNLGHALHQTNCTKTTTETSNIATTEWLNLLLKTIRENSLCTPKKWSPLLCLSNNHWDSYIRFKNFLPSSAISVT
jgi:hypothetical protein